MKFIKIDDNNIINLSNVMQIAIYPINTPCVVLNIMTKSYTLFSGSREDAYKVYNNIIDFIDNPYCSNIFDYKNYKSKKEYESELSPEWMSKTFGINIGTPTDSKQGDQSTSPAQQPVEKQKIEKTRKK